MIRIRTWILIVSACICNQATAGAILEATGAWIREAPPTSRVLAGYITLGNPGSMEVTVTQVDSPDFESIEIHNTVIEDGIARMIPVEKLVVPVNGTISLQPGGMHLMLFNPVRLLSAGDDITLIIHSNSSNSLKVTVPVKRMTGADQHHHHH